MSIKSTTGDVAGPTNSNDDRRDPGPASIKWMAALGLKEGEWFHASKPALRAGMRPTFELKARVWCCGILHTQSYQGECAMTKFRNKIIPLSPAAIAKELRDEALEFYAAAGKVLTKDQEKALNVRRQHVRRVLVELERESLAERRTADGTRLRDLSPDELKRLPIGRIRLYFFLRPLPSKTVPDVAINGYVSFAFLSPRESRLLNKVLQRFELEPEPYVAGEGYVQETVKVAIAGYVERNNVALQDYRKAKDVAAQTLKKALDVAISSERIVRNPVSNPTVRREAPAPAREAPPVSEAPVRKATTTTTEKPAAPLPPAENDVVVVSTKLGVHPSAGKAFVAACRAAAPVCTVEQIVATIDAVDATIDKRTFKNPTGILLKAVPPKLAAEVKAAEEWRAANTVTCWSCHKPIHPEDARMRGAHQACWDAEEVKGTE